MNIPTKDHHFVFDIEQNKVVKKWGKKKEKANIYKVCRCESCSIRKKNNRMKMLARTFNRKLRKGEDVKGMGYF